MGTTEASTLHVRNVNLALTALGKGLPFVWAHGMTSSRTHENETGLFDWSAVTDVARWVRYDARAHGRSGATYDPDDYTWPHLAMDMLGVADALGLSGFIAGGASMGAATALHAAVQAPDRIAALVLAIPPTAWDSRAERLSVYRDIAAFVERQGLRALVRVEEGEPLPRIFAEEYPEVRQMNLRSEAAMDEAAYCALMRGAALSDFPTAAAIRTLCCPTLLLAWSDDPTHPVSTAESLHALMPCSTLHVAHALAEIRTWPIRVHTFLTEVCRRETT